MKQRPKSCSCAACKRGKASEVGKAAMRMKERAYRHMTRIQLLKGSDEINPAPKGGYFD